MKQKRKVKSLLPQKKDWRSSILTAVLLILSVVLCIGSASLITSTARAAEPGLIGRFTYTGLDEKQEVLYGMSFVDPSTMTRVINSMYIKGKSFYITPNPVIVNPLTAGSSESINTNVNKVKNGVYGHVLGGYSNEVRSQNVTLIAGRENVVPEGNDNAALLGGVKNQNFGSMKNDGTPMVVVGGETNKIGNNHDGVVLIGGKNNEVGNNVSNGFILGGEGNVIGDGRSNVIVGGTNVTVESVDNVFVYSNKGDGVTLNDGFKPKSSNAFYLNVEEGVGINTTASKRGLAVGGAVSLGEIDIKTVPCNDTNLGVKGSYQNCIVGCTKAGIDATPNSKWEMLDRGDTCQGICRDEPNHCIYTGEVIKPEPSYPAYCVAPSGANFTGNSHMCYEDELEDYENVVFETSLIDSDTECPPTNENKCVYQCDEGYHLTGNVAGGNGSTYRCYKDCEYEWADGTKQILKHNETVSAYNVQTVSCSNDIYVFPFETEIIKKGLPALTPAGLSVGNKTVNGVTYKNRATNGYSPETCVNYEHKKTLVCNNGTMYLTMDNDSKRANTSLNAKAKGYKYKNCDTANYRCKTGTGEYQFTKTDITNSFSNSGLQDSGTGWDNKKDRQEFDLTRGRYKLCLDYDKVEGNNEICNVVDGANPHEEHYKFVRCQDGYDEYPTGSKKCMQKCTVKTDDGATVTINHAAIYEFYLKGSETCTGVCIGQNFECNDGTFYSTGADHKKRQDSNYKYSKCTLNKFRCDKAEYNVTYYQWNNLNWKAKGHYSSCDDYDPDPSNGKNAKACKKVETNYKLDYCYEGYHTEDMRECIDNVHLENCEKPKTDPANWYWVRSSGPIQTYPWSNIITAYKSYVDEGMYFKRWSDSCSWNDPASLCWVDEYPDGNNDGKVVPGEACEWRCKKSYVKNANGDGCRYIETTCKYPNNDDNACVNTEPYDCEDVEAEITDKGVGAGEGEWRWKCYNGVRSDACLLCKDGYHKEVVNGVEVCVENKDAKCGTTHYNCAPGKADDRNSNEAKWRWNCLALDSNGYGCTQSRDDEGCYECRYGYHTTSTYGECEEDTAKLYYHNNGKSKAILPTPNPETMRYTKQTRAKDMDDIEGYKFVKWCTTTNGQGGRCYTAGQEIKKAMDVPAEDIHLYAIWEENTATLTYDATNCGGSTWDVTMYYSSKTTADDIRSDEVDDCYTFDDQWCDDRWSCYSPRQEIKPANQEPENMTLYAQCTQKEYTITYDPNRGRWSDGTTTNKVFSDVQCGDITLEGAPDRDYHTFKGWESSIDHLVYMPGATYPLKADVTMTAQWEEKHYECRLHHYECGGGEDPTNKDTPYNSTKWTWNCGYEDCYECRDGYDDDGNGNCIKNQDGECDYSKTEPACENGVAPHIEADSSDAYGAVTVWTCPAMGNGTAAICGASWRCEGGGTCKARENVNFCGYVGRAGSDHFDINNKSHCINAGAYGTINPLSVKGRCYTESNVFTYSMDSCEAVAGQGYSYSSCFEWEEDASSYTLTCKIMDDNGNLNVPSSESSCRPIESKKPKCDGSELKINGECGEKINTCVAGDFMDIEDDDSHIKWVCKGIGSNSTTASCTKYIPAQSSDGYYQLTWNYIDGCGACPWWECDSSQEGWRYTRFKTIEGCEDARLWYGGRLHPSGNESLWCSSCKYHGSSSGGGSSSSAMIKNPAVESKCTYSSSLPGLPKVYSSNSDCINDNIWKYGAVVNGVYKSNITSQSQCPTGTCIPCATCSG